jgi:hypothetical protein
MTNDSGLFRTRKELEETEGAYPIGGSRYRSASGEYVPLYEGKMVQAFDHRAASVVVNPENQHRPAQPIPTTPAQHRDPTWLPAPQFWVAATLSSAMRLPYVLTFKDVTAPTNVRSMIAAFIPGAALGNTITFLLGDPDGSLIHASAGSLLLANLNSIAFDFTARQKIQGQHLNWYIVEQVATAPLLRHETTRFGAKSAADIVRAAVLELTYTAHDMAPFASDIGYVDAAGVVKPPFVWDEDGRLKLRAKLDAVYFHLYGVIDRDDVRYIYSTFPIVEREEMAAFNRYRSRDLCLAYMNALAAGEPDAEIDL